MLSSWEPARSLEEDAVSGAEIAAAACLLTMAVTCLPLSFGIHSIFCSEWARLCITAFHVKVLFFFFFSLSGDPTV